jgi:hypothetical protein
VKRSEKKNIFISKRKGKKLREELFEDIEENLNTEDKEMLFLKRKFNNQLIGIKN